MLFRSALSFATSTEWCSVLPLLRAQLLRRGQTASFGMIPSGAVSESGSRSYRWDRAKTPNQTAPPPPLRPPHTRTPVPSTTVRPCSGHHHQCRQHLRRRAAVPRGYLLHRDRHLLQRHLLRRHRLATPLVRLSFRQCARHLLDEMASGDDDLGEAGVGPETRRVHDWVPEG